MVKQFLRAIFLAEYAPAYWSVQALNQAVKVQSQPELHRKAALAATDKGLSLNAFVEDAIRHCVS